MKTMHAGKRAVATSAAVGLVIVGGMLPAPVAEAQSAARLAYVTVIDNEQGVPLIGLEAEDFFVVENGVRREVLRVGPATDPMQLAVLVDTSTASRPVLTEFRVGLEGFVDELPQVSEISVATFGGPRNMLVQPTNRLDRARESFARLFSRPDTATYLLGALSDTARGFDRRGALRPAIVVLTTNGVDFSEEEPQEVVTSLQEAGVAMHVVSTRTATVQMNHTGAFGTAGFPSWASRTRDYIIDAGPKQTGGSRIDISAQSGAAGALQQIAFELSSQYALVYSSAATLLAGHMVQVGVELPDLTVRATPSRVVGR